jgi:hypothetical protein
MISTSTGSRILTLLALLTLALGRSPALLAAEAAAPSNGVLLQYNLKKGDVFPYRLAMDITSKVSVPSQPDMDVSAKLQMVMRMAVQDVNQDGSYQIETQVSDAKLTANGQEMPLTATAIPPITMTVTKNGVVKNVKGLEGLAGGSAVPGLDPTSFSNMMSNMAVFPEKPIKVNDTWTYTTPITFPGSKQVTATTKARLVGLETTKDGTPVARVNASVNVPLDLSLPQPSGTTTMKGQQVGTVTTLYSRANGMPVDANGTTNMTAKITANSVGPDGKPNNVSMDMTMKMQIHMLLDPTLKGTVPATGTATTPPPPPPPAPSQ